jgi:hypothetical protein
MRENSAIHYGMRPTQLAWAVVFFTYLSVVMQNPAHSLNQRKGLNAAKSKPFQTFPVGDGPVELAFDGTNIWVANWVGNSVMKLRPSDGSILGTFKVGTRPLDLCSDGANTWVANSDSNTVTKLRASDGMVLNTFDVGSKPHGVLCDGSNIWVANNESNNVSKLRASDGVVLGAFPAGEKPNSLISDGTNIWVTNNPGATVTKLSEDGKKLGEFHTGESPSEMAFDGANIWVANTGSNNVTELRARDGKALGSFPAGGPQRLNAALDGTNIWVVSNGTLDNYAHTICRLRAVDGSMLETFKVGRAPAGVAFDGVNMWIGLAGANSVAKVPVKR